MQQNIVVTRVVSRQMDRRSVNDSREVQAITELCVQHTDTMAPINISLILHLFDLTNTMIDILTTKHLHDDVLSYIISSISGERSVTANCHIGEGAKEYA